MSFGMQVFAFLLVLGPLIFLHELGHFIGAKRAGIRVLEFGMFYPPRVRRLWRGQGVLVINGARVIVPRNFELPKTLADGQTVRADVEKVKGRLALKSIEVLAPDQAALPAPVSLTDASRGGSHAAGYAGATPEACSAPNCDPLSLTETRLFGEVSQLDPGTEYTFNWLPLGGFVRMLGEEGASGRGSFGDAPKRWRAVTLLAGPGLNLVAAIIILVAAFAIGGPDPDGIPKVLVGGVASDSPALQVGLKAKDQILAVDRQPLIRAGFLQEYIAAHRSQSLTLSIQRGGETFEVAITPRTPEQTPPGQGAMGVTLDYLMATKPYPLGESIDQSFRLITGNVEQIALLPGRLIQGAISAGEARPVGPVGISQLAANQLQLSLDTRQPFWILSLVAQISLALAITNLLPLPALDGGRLIFVLIEAVRGKRISPQREAIVHLIGMAMLLGLMALITIQDVSNPIIPN
jgi:regulator of sigma E protease